MAHLCDQYVLLLRFPNARRIPRKITVIFVVFVTEITILNYIRNIDICNCAIFFSVKVCFPFISFQVPLLDLCVSQAFFQCLWNLVSRPR